MRQTGNLFESNSDSEGGELFRYKKTAVNEPPSPDLKRRTRGHSRESWRGMETKNIEKENRQVIPRGDGGRGDGRRGRLEESEDFLGQRLKLPVGSDSGRHKPLIKQEPQETPPRRQSSRAAGRSSSRASPSQATNASAAKKLSNFKAAERAGRTICVCGASAYYERERFALLKEKAKLKEDQQALREESKRVMENHRKVKEEIFECEKRRNELESSSRSLQRSREMQQEEAAVLEQSRRQLQKLKDQIEKDKEALQRTQQDLILKGEEYATRKSHMERLQQDYKSKKAELEDKSIQLRKQAMKNESVEATLEMESNKLASLQSDLALESEKIKEREKLMRENETRYEEKRRTLQNMESRVNHEVLMNDEKIKFLETREAELQRRATEWEARDAELKAQLRDLEKQKQELSMQKSDFEFQRQRELESIENEKKAATLEIQLSKEDCAAFIELEKEWVLQEKENLNKHKESVQHEIEAEKEHMQQMINQMRKRNTEIIEEEKEEWRREQQRITESRNRQRLELESMRESLSQKEYELNNLRESLNNEREQLEQEKIAMDTFKETEMKKLQNEKNDIVNMGHQARKDRQACSNLEAQLKARSHTLDARETETENRARELQEQWKTLERIQSQWDSRNKELESKRQQLLELQQSLAKQSAELSAREKRLTHSESQAVWMKEIYAELTEKKQAIAEQEKRLEMEKAALAEQRHALQTCQQTPHARSVTRPTRPVPKKAPGVRLCRRLSSTGLPPLQTVLPAHSRLRTPVITVSSGGEEDDSCIQRHVPPTETETAHFRAASVPDKAETVAEWSMFAAFEEQPFYETQLETVSPRGEYSVRSKESSVQPETRRPEGDEDDISLSSRNLFRHLGEGTSSSFELLGGGCVVTYETETDEPPSLAVYDTHAASHTLLDTHPHTLLDPHTRLSPQETASAELSQRLSYRREFLEDAPESNRDETARRDETERRDEMGRRRDETGRGRRDGVSPAAPVSSARSRAEETALSRRSRAETASTCQREETLLSCRTREEVASARRAEESSVLSSRVLSSRVQAEEETAFQEDPSPQGHEELSRLSSSGHEGSPLMYGRSPRDGELNSEQRLDFSVSEQRMDFGGSSEQRMDFGVSVGPSLSESLLAQCTDDVRAVIEQTQRMAYGGTRWAHAEAEYEATSRALSSISEDAPPSKQARSIGTSERTTTVAHENEGPPNVWE